MQKEPINTSNLDLSSTTPIICENCGNETFKPIFFLRKISRFLTGEDKELGQSIVKAVRLAVKDRVLPMDSLACVNCNHVNKEFNPNPISEQTQNKNKKDE